MKNGILSIVALIALFMASCTGSGNEENTTETNDAEATPIDAPSEVEKWKNELVDGKKVGTPCNFESLTSPEAKEWTEKNAEQMNGIPTNEAEIKTVSADLNGDGNDDLLMYFVAENCTGHNGGTPSFAKIVYTDGATDNDLISDIKQSVINAYNEKRKADATLKEVTEDYLAETLSISYENGIAGKFSLYTTEDAHCCPSYSGTYSYDTKAKKATIEIKENQK